MRFIPSEQPPSGLPGLKEWLTRLVININASIKSTAYSFDTLIINNSFTTYGKQVIICNNESEINIVLDSKPSIGDELYIKNSGTALVTVTGTINGIENLVINNNGTTVHLYFANEWISL